MSSELRLIFILGAHRSGTSALAGALEACGLPLGPVDRSSSAFNERGHFSNPAVDAMNAALLAPLRSEVLLTSQDDLAILRILTAYQPPLAGIKSPERMYTAALWAGHSAGVRVVATIRHPSAVVRSARRRLATEQGSAPPSAALLARWRDYNTMLLALRERLPFPIVDFSGPFDRYVDQIRGASEALGVIFDPKAVLTFLSGISDMNARRRRSIRRRRSSTTSSGSMPTSRRPAPGKFRRSGRWRSSGRRGCRARWMTRARGSAIVGISPSCDWPKRCARSSA